MDLYDTVFALNNIIPYLCIFFNNADNAFSERKFECSFVVEHTKSTTFNLLQIDVKNVFKNE